MSLTRMGKDAETVRFLDDVDLTFSLDSRISAAQQTTSIELTSQPVVFRASYRDINLITTIVNKAIELYGKSLNKRSAGSEGQSAIVDDSSKALQHRSSTGRGGKTTTRTTTLGHAKVVMSKEQVWLSTTSVYACYNKRYVAEGVV